jgi:hypothetical protein
MKIITSLLASAALLAGIVMATAQSLPTNPPAPQEGGANPPSTSGSSGSGGAGAGSSGR